MNQAEIITQWYNALSLSENLGYKLLRNTQTKDGLFTLKKEDKFIMDDTSISNILYFLKGIQHNIEQKL